MEISIKFTKEELRIMWEALNMGAIHHQDDNISNEMINLMKKVEMLASLSKNN